ncbi:hypothetical protein BDF20DRAFT_816989 [Mycotypha africana]|uniref:uncharacterized protein n=1 Tax=Mycotypha africana TaxID=64632 RepID=UPI0023015184|nr:uncharacterized protein BDF20DRAFT_816989 [Mycotypha africana]KAI8984470.1 hypothetical protein BDF20DRAFT_816989 [Mycotypha africana]
MRHPDILSYLDGVETEQSIMFVTEPVEPLSNQLKQDPDNNLLLWGLYKVANAIKFLNEDCDMVHGNIKVASIFTNKAGEWKLGGFELLCSMKEESPIILTFGGLVPEAQRYATPEVKKSGWTVIKELPSGAIDSYHLGCLIYETYNHRFETTESLLLQKGNIPTSMHRIYTNLVNPTSRNRASADMFLDEGLRPKGFFSADFVKVNLFLENISIKDQSEREGFFRKLDSCIDTFPSEFSKHKILPELVKAFEFGSGGAKALSAMLKVGEHLEAEEYQSVVIQPIIRMFASPDRAIRVSLLDNMSKFVDHMTNKMVTNQVFPNIATGFTDTVPIIREQTIRSILLIVPKLSDRIVNNDLLKYLAKLQMDPEPGIRTNTTICLGKIAKHLNDSTRKKVLVNAFTRSLRDGFHHARVAALMALNATSEFYDAQECATRIIPAVSAVLLDKEKVVRDQAFKVINSLLKKIEDHADKMPETAIVDKPATPVNGDNSVNSSKMASVLGGATKGIADWAVSSLQSRFASPTGEIANPVSKSPSATSPTLNQAITPDKVSIPSASSTSLGFNSLDTNDDIEDTTGWDNEDSVPFDDFSEQEQAGNFKDGWENFDETEPAITRHGNTPISSFGSFSGPANNFTTSSSSRANGSMKLGHKAKTLDLNVDKDIDDFVTQIATDSKRSSPLSSISSKDSRKAELERRREERRQRMAELREKKKAGTGGLGAKKTTYSLGTLLLPTPTDTIPRTTDEDSDELDLYQFWASNCRNRDKLTSDDNVRIAATVNNLWKTVTQTVNCGGGHAITVTRTINAQPTSTSINRSSKNSKRIEKTCSGQCWSDYLWHTYGDSISPAQGFTATMTWIGLVNNEPAGGYPLGDVIYICVSAGLGLMGAVFLVFLYPLGVYCLACLGGFYFANVARVCFIIGISLLGPVILYFVETYMILFATALMGAYLFYFGLDLFAHTGFINPWLLIFDGNPRHKNMYLMSKPIYIMLAFVIINTLISIGWQYYYNIICLKAGFGRNPKVEKQPEDEKKKAEGGEAACPPPTAYMCVPTPPPPYCPPQQPVFMQNIATAAMPYYQHQQ